MPGSKGGGGEGFEHVKTEEGPKEEEEGKKTSCKHLKLVTVTWRPTPRSEIIRQIYSTCQHPTRQQRVLPPGIVGPRKWLMGGQRNCTLFFHSLQKFVQRWWDPTGQTLGLFMGGGGEKRPNETIAVMVRHGSVRLFDSSFREDRWWHHLRLAPLGVLTNKHV
ncbi:hypothetical protein LZ31DRAFT_281644 [Colletotrichum somersetense]|nr:hypothetical protein LZ31DRAFT_281644 [Colletotrichum somersetense]